LFFAGITSSLAMGTPCMGFLMDEFNWKRERAAWAFGGAILILGLPTVLFFEQGVFDEYDYWAGTVSLVVFALAEIILFAWVFGMDKGWKEINRGADIKVNPIFKFVIQFVTPFILGWVFIASLPDIWKKITNADLKAKLLETTDPAQIQAINDQMAYLNGSRVLLVALFISISYLVYVAYRKRVKEGRGIV
jgi:NSS family neurotransmitter:Na+ symporter